MDVELIRQLAKLKGINSLKQLETNVGFGNGTIRKWGTQSPSINKVYRVANYLNVSLDYLFTGKENRPSELSEDEQELLTYFKDLPHDQQQQLVGMAILLQEQVKEQENDEEPELIHLYYDPNLRVSAGLGKEILEYQQWEKVLVLKTPESCKANFILTVEGDSMETKFHENDLVLVKEQPDVYDGQIGVFRLNGKGYIKKKIGNRLISLNKKYPDLIINSEDYKCFGLVLGTTKIIKSDVF